MASTDIARYTASGAPYYVSAKNATSSNVPTYIFWEPIELLGCGPAWHLAYVQPSLTHNEYLLQDYGKGCSYFASITSVDSSQPPYGTHLWGFLCDGAWAYIPVTIASLSPSAPPVPSLPPSPPMPP